MKILKNSYHVIGVMSGTSLDGIDLVYTSFDKTATWNFKILNAKTVAYSLEWKKRLQEGIGLSRKDLDILNKEYTFLLAQAINAFINDLNIETIDAICSHGHTIHHQPEKQYTLQIGNLPQLRSLLKYPVICDFRVQDVQLGGQGAPLVPVGDQLLFSAYDYCLNLGGFANVSTEIEGVRIAYDVCPINIVMNHYVNKVGLEFDDGGSLAATGVVNQSLLSELNDLPFYKAAAPKSLGYEWVLEAVLPLIETYALPIQDVLSTFTAHVVQQLAAVFPKGKVLVTGGGAYNSNLISKLRSHINAEIHIPTRTLIEYKEALIFGLLGVLRLREEVNVLCAVTGASHDHSSGIIW